MCRASVVVAGVVVAITIAAPGAARADRSVAGTVVDDATGQPVAGALVSIGAAESPTDDTGHFAIANAPFGRLDLLVIADGYRAYFGSARAGAELALRLEPEAGGNEVIHVSGQQPSGPPLHLGTEEIRSLPGAGNDALRALQ